MDRLREVIVHALVGGVAGCIGWAANGGRAVRGFFRRPWSHLMLLFMVLLVIVALFHNEPDSIPPIDSRLMSHNTTTIFNSTIDDLGEMQVPLLRSYIRNIMCVGFAIEFVVLFVFFPIFLLREASSGLSWLITSIFLVGHFANIMFIASHVHAVLILIPWPPSSSSSANKKGGSLPGNNNNNSNNNARREVEVASGDGVSSASNENAMGGGPAPSSQPDPLDIMVPRLRRRHNARVEPGGPVDINFVRTLPGMQNYPYSSREEREQAEAEAAQQQQQQEQSNVDGSGVAGDESVAKDQNAGSTESTLKDPATSVSAPENSTNVMASESQVPPTPVASTSANKEPKSSRHAKDDKKTEGEKKTKNQLKTEEVRANIDRRRDEHDKLKQAKRAGHDASHHHDGKPPAKKEKKEEKTQKKEKKEPKEKMEKKGKEKRGKMGKKTKEPKEKEPKEKEPNEKKEKEPKEKKEKEQKGKKESKEKEQKETNEPKEKTEPKKATELRKVAPKVMPKSKPKANPLPAPKPKPKPKSKPGKENGKATPLMVTMPLSFAPVESSDEEDFRDGARSISGASIEDFMSRIPLEQRAVGVGRPQHSMMSAAVAVGGGGGGGGAWDSSSSTSSGSDFSFNMGHYHQHLCCCCCGGFYYTPGLRILSLMPTTLPNITACLYLYEGRIYCINLTNEMAANISSASLASRIIKSVRWVN